jgi:hypothetical protein
MSGAKIRQGLRGALEWAQGTSLPADTRVRACNCVGPRPGEPVCPCRMGSLTIHNGRWVQVIDHGPASPSHNGEGE